MVQQSAILHIQAAVCERTFALTDCCFFFLTKKKKIIISLLTDQELSVIIFIVAESIRQSNTEVWLSLVERCVRDAEAAGSSPVTSTIIKGRQNLPSFFVLSDRCALPFSLAYRERFGPLSFLCGNCHIFSNHSKKTCAFLNFIYNY